MKPPPLKIESLRTHFFRRDGILKAVDGLDIEVRAGEILALVGESGCGKTVTAHSIMRLVSPPGRVVGGAIYYCGKNLLNFSEKEMAAVRGKGIALILQDSGAALNPVMRVGEQIAEVLRHHYRIGKKEARQKTIALMENVQLPNAAVLYRCFPHELSGGQRQRVSIAIALGCKPALLIADEPTTALDVTIQCRILELLRQLTKERGIALLLITHDFGAVAQIAERVAVMYAGKVVEQGRVPELFRNPLHPYTNALLSSVPRLELPVAANVECGWMRDVPSPDLMNLPSGCAFHPRCPIAEDLCAQNPPQNLQMDQNRYVRCLKKEKCDEKTAPIESSS